MSDYVPKYKPTEKVLEAAAPIAAETSVVEIIDRIIEGRRSQSDEEFEVLLFALVSGVLNSAPVPMLAVVGQFVSQELEESWVDTGCDCPRCEVQRNLRKDRPAGKPN